jgi:hypothetical protein
VLPPGTSLIRFTAEFSVNLFAVCCFATALLWACTLYRSPSNRIAKRITNVLGVYFVLFYLRYALRLMTPPGPYLVVLPTMAIAWLPIGCSFALMASE